MQGEIVERPPARFVGLRVVGSFDSLGDLVPQARRELLRRQFEISPLVDPDTQLGVSIPREPVEPPHEVATHIGFEVASPGADVVPKGMRAIELPGGRYARFEYRGSFLEEEFEGFYPGLFAWLKDRGLPPSDDAPWIEVYGRDHDWEDKGNPSNGLAVLIPLEGQVRA